MLPLIQKAVVEEYRWMSEDDMIDCIAVCQSMPGVVAINTSTYVGYKRQGLLGSIFATLGTITPSLVIIILAVMFLRTAGENRYIEGGFKGVKAASCGMILYSAYRLGKQVFKSKFAWAVGIVSFSMIALFGITALWGIIFGALAGLALSWYKAVKGGEKS